MEFSIQSRSLPQPATRNISGMRVCAKKIIASSARIVQAIWPQTLSRNLSGMNMSLFIESLLLRTYGSCTTLMIALYYVMQLNSRVPRCKLRATEGVSGNSQDPEGVLSCGWRMFFTALLLAFKYHKDSYLTIDAWSTVSGFSSQEIHRYELVVLHALDWNLYISPRVYRRFWRLVTALPTSPPPPRPSSRTRTTAAYAPLSNLLGPQPKTFERRVAAADEDFAGQTAAVPPSLTALSIAREKVAAFEEEL